MENDFKPQGYNSASPYFIVDGALKMIEFLGKLFGAKELRRFDGGDGKIMHAEVKIDDSVIMLSDATENYPANTLVMHVYVPDSDDVYDRALALGCKGIQKPEVKDGDPDKRGTFTDFAGNMWSVSTQVTK